MSVRSITWAWDQEADPISKFVLVALADVSDDHGQSFPSLAWIEHKTGLSERCIQYHLRALEEMGLLKIEERQRKNGSDTSSLYTLYMPKVSPRQGAPHAPTGAPHAPPQRGAPHAPPEPLTLKLEVEGVQNAPETGVADAARSGAEVEAKTDGECDAELPEGQIDAAAAVKMGPSETWGVAKELLRRGTGLAEWCRLYRYVHGWELSNGEIRLEAPSILAASEIDRKHHQAVDDALLEAAGTPVEWSIYKRPGAEIGL